MSIEAKIEALTKALEANTAALLGGVAKPAGKPIIGADQKVIDSAPLLNEAKPTAALTYDEVKTPFLNLVKKSRDSAIACLQPPTGEFKYESLKAAKPEHFAAILAAVNKALV